MLSNVVLALCVAASRFLILRGGTVATAGAVGNQIFLHPLLQNLIGRGLPLIGLLALLISKQSFLFELVKLVNRISKILDRTSRMSNVADNISNGSKFIKHTESSEQN